MNHPTIINRTCFNSIYNVCELRSYGITMVDHYHGISAIITTIVWYDAISTNWKLWKPRLYCLYRTINQPFMDSCANCKLLWHDFWYTQWTTWQSSPLLIKITIINWYVIQMTTNHGRNFPSTSFITHHLTVINIISQSSILSSTNFPTSFPPCDRRAEAPHGKAPHFTGARQRQVG